MFYPVIRSARDNVIMLSQAVCLINHVTYYLKTITEAVLLLLCKTLYSASDNVKSAR